MYGFTRRWMGHWLDEQTQRAVVSSSVPCGAHTELMEALMLFIFINNQNDYIESIVSKVWGSTRPGRADHTLITVPCYSEEYRRRTNAHQIQWKHTGVPHGRIKHGAVPARHSLAKLQLCREENKVHISQPLQQWEGMGYTSSLGSRVRDISSPCHTASGLFCPVLSFPTFVSDFFSFSSGKSDIDKRLCSLIS